MEQPQLQLQGYTQRLPVRTQETASISVDEDHLLEDQSFIFKSAPPTQWALGGSVFVGSCYFSQEVNPVLTAQKTISPMGAKAQREEFYSFIKAPSFDEEDITYDNLEDYLIENA